MGRLLQSRSPVQRFTASTATPAEHAAAAARHRDDRRAVVAELAGMATSTDPLTSNTARWLQTGHSELFALTLTADHAARAAARGKAPELAMFGAERTVLDAAEATYNTGDMDDERGISFVPAESGGFRPVKGGKVFITQPSRRAELNATLMAAGKATFDPVTDSLKHEVQHETDVAFNTETADAHDDDDRALAEYRTEFRAYTAQMPEWLASPLTAAETAELETWNLMAYEWPGGVVQRKIFLQIIMQYPKVKAAWTADRKVSRGGTYREAVLEMHGPLTAISANPENSPEVDTLWGLINESTFRAVERTGEVVAAARAVSPGDRARMLERRSLWRNWLHDDGWQETEVRVLLSDDPSRFGAARAEMLRQETVERQREERSQPPVDLFMERYRSWDDVLKMIKAADLDTIERWQDEFKEASGDDPFSRAYAGAYVGKNPYNRDYVGMFVVNTTGGANGMDWWQRLEQ